LDSLPGFAYKAAILLIVDDLDDRPGRPVGVRSIARKSGNRFFAQAMLQTCRIDHDFRLLTESSKGDVI
jgi:hypothetical protein